MTPEARAALHKIADEIADLQPVPSTFKGIKDTAAAARVTLRMVVELIRERADGKPDSSTPASDAHLAEMARTR